MPRPVVLVGLPGAGKTTVARLAASLLDAPWFDLDHQIAADQGLSVLQIFETRGEQHFRALEREMMARILAGPPAIVATGGGWAAQPGNLAGVGPAALSLYMSVSPEVAATRLGGAGDRPLLAGDPLPRLRELLAVREEYYRRADLELDAGSAPDLVAHAVAVAARQYGGW